MAMLTLLIILAILLFAFFFTIGLVSDIKNAWQSLTRMAKGPKPNRS